MRIPKGDNIGNGASKLDLQLFDGDLLEYLGELLDAQEGDLLSRVWIHEGGDDPPGEVQPSRGVEYEHLVQPPGEVHLHGGDDVAQRLDRLYICIIKPIWVDWRHPSCLCL